MANISKHKTKIGNIDDSNDQSSSANELEPGSQSGKLHNRDNNIDPASGALNVESNNDLKFDENVSDALDSDSAKSDEATNKDDSASGELDADGQDSGQLTELDKNKISVTKTNSITTKTTKKKSESQDESEDNTDTESSKSTSEEGDDFEPQWRKKRHDNKKRRNHRKLMTFLVLIALVVIATLSYSVSRHWLLDKSGWKRSFYIVFVDKDGHNPIADLTVELDGQTRQTDSEGEVVFESVGLGLHSLKASKPGYGPVDKNLALEPWTRASLPEENMQMIGIRLQFIIQDYLSAKPIQGSKLSVNNLTSSSDEQGQSTLVIPPTSNTSVKVKIDAFGYHTQTVNLATNQTARQTINLIPSQLNYFISNRSGTYDVYSSWLDGSHTEKVLPGSGQENPKSLGLYIAPNNKKAFMISTRDGLQSTDGGTQTELFELDLISAKLSKIDQGVIESVGWSGDYFIYTNLDLRKAYNDPGRQTLKSANYKSGSVLTLVKTNYISSSPQIVGSQIYFSPNDTFNSGKSNFFSSVDADGGNLKPLVQDKIISRVSRVSYSTIGLRTDNGMNYTYEATSGKVHQGGSGSQAGRQYYVSPDGKNYTWVEQRDGKDTLLIKDKSDGKILSQVSGLGGPIHWIGNDVIVFQVVDSTGSYDWAVSLNGGEAKKISSVSKLGE